MSFNSFQSGNFQPVDPYRVLFSSIHVSDRQAAAFYSRYPGDPLLYFSCSIVSKLGGVQVLRSANREKPFLDWQPEVLRLLRRFLSTYVYYIIHDSTNEVTQDTMYENATVKVVTSRV